MKTVFLVLAALYTATSAAYVDPHSYYDKCCNLARAPQRRGRYCNINPSMWTCGAGYDTHCINWNNYGASNDNPEMEKVAQALVKDNPGCRDAITEFFCSVWCGVCVEVPQSGGSYKYLGACNTSCAKVKEKCPVLANHDAFKGTFNCDEKVFNSVPGETCSLITPLKGKDNDFAQALMIICIVSFVAIGVVAAIWENVVAPFYARRANANKPIAWKI